MSDHPLMFKLIKLLVVRGQTRVEWSEGMDLRGWPAAGVENRHGHTLLVGLLVVTDLKLVRRES